MKKLVCFLTATILISALSVYVMADEPEQLEQRSYFSLDPDASCQRVSAVDFHYYFIDAGNNLCEIVDDNTIKPLLSDVVEVKATNAVNFAVKTDGSLWSWSDVGSYNGNQCLGRALDEADIFASMRKPEKVIDNVSYVYIFDRFCYAILADDSLWGWGCEARAYSKLYLGNGNAIGSVEPVKILDDVADVMAVRGNNASNMFARKTDGSLWAWGTNAEGALGLGNVTDVFSPQKVMDDVKAFVPGDNSLHWMRSVFNYAIKNDNSLWAWGQGERGNLGNGSTDDCNIPVKIMEDVKTSGVGMALKQDGSLWIWGADTKINATIAYSSTPLKFLDDVSEVCVQDYTYYAIKTDGSLYVFDYEGRYTLQNGEVTYSKGRPEKLMDNVRHVFVEDRYGFGFGARVYVEKTDGSLWGWGKDFTLYPHGEIDSDYEKTWYNKPQKLVEGPITQRVYAGNDVEYVVMGDGSLWWYMLYPDEAAPVLLSKITEDVKQVSAYSSALILKTDGSVWAWRGNQNWQVGSKPPKDEYTLVEIANGEKTAFFASPTSSTISVDGKNVVFDAYNINGNNYFKLRDLAYILASTGKQFEVIWDTETNSIILTSGKPYTIVGGEMTGKGTADKAVIATTAKVYLDGTEVNFMAYSIEGNNYFKLRDIGKALDFGVTWDWAEDTVIIDTSIGYVSE